MAKQVTLNELRRRALRRDRALPALKPIDAPRHGPIPQTLDELEPKLGAYGKVAVECANWAAICAWLMKELPATTEPPIVAHTAADLMRKQALIATGLHHPDGGPLFDEFGGLSQESQNEAERVAQITMGDWERAGRPYLDRNRLRFTYQLFTACIRATEAAQDGRA